MELRVSNLQLPLNIHALLTELDDTCSVVEPTKQVELISIVGILMDVSWGEQLVVYISLKLVRVNVVPDDLFGGTADPQDVVDVVLEE